MPSGRRSGRSALVRLGPTGRIPSGLSSSRSPEGRRRGSPNGSYRIRNWLSPVVRAGLSEAVDERPESFAGARARRRGEASGEPRC